MRSVRVVQTFINGELVYDRKLESQQGKVLPADFILEILFVVARDFTGQGIRVRDGRLALRIHC